MIIKLAETETTGTFDCVGEGDGHCSKRNIASYMSQGMAHCDGDQQLQQGRIHRLHAQTPHLCLTYILLVLTKACKMLGELEKNQRNC